MQKTVILLAVLMLAALSIPDAGAQQPAQMTTTLPDRTVWEGRQQCGASEIATTLIVFGGINSPTNAFLVLNTATVQRGRQSVSERIYAYGRPSRDNTLDTLTLFNGAPLSRGGSPVNRDAAIVPPARFELSLQGNQSQIRGRLDQGRTAGGCEIALQRKPFYSSTVEAWSNLKANPDALPPVLMAAARTVDEFCIALTGWANQARTRPVSRPTRRSRPDLEEKMFVESVLHESLAKKYLGSDVRTANIIVGSGSFFQLVDECGTHPLFIENKTVYDQFFQQNLRSYIARKDGLDRIADIQRRADRIDEVGERFTEDSEGLTRLAQYIASIDADLAGAIPEVRDAVLRPARRRQSLTSMAFLRNSLASTERPSVEQLAARRDAASVVRENRLSTPDDEAVLARVDQAIARDLAVSVAIERATITQTPVTPAGLAGLVAWRAAFTRTYTAFAATEPVKAAVAEAMEREAALPLEMLSAAAQSTATRSVEQLVALRAETERVRQNSPPSSQREAVLALADAAITRDLQTLIAVDKPSQDIPPTQEGVSILAAWHAVLTQTYAPLASEEPVKAALSDVTAREAGMPLIMLRASSELPATRTVSQLVTLRADAERVRQNTAPSPERDAVLARVDAVIVRDLQTLIAADRPPQDIPPTQDGVSRLASWHAVLTQTYAPFASAEPVKAALAEVTEREAGMPLAMLRASSESAGTRTVAQLVTLRSDAERVRSGSAPSPEREAVLASVDTVILNDLRALIAAGRPSPQDTPSTPAGLARLVAWRTALVQTYAPFASAEPVTAALAEAAEREAAVHVAMLRADITTGGARSIEQLVALRAAISQVQAAKVVIADSRSVVTDAEAVIARNLAALVAADQATIQNIAPTPEGLTRLAAWRANLARTYAPFINAEAVQAAMADGATRQAGLITRYAADVQSQVANAADAPAIRALRASSESRLIRSDRAGFAGRQWKRADRKSLCNRTGSVVQPRRGDAAGRPAAPRPYGRPQIAGHTGNPGRRVTHAKGLPGDRYAT